MSAGFIYWWAAAVVLAGLCLRMYYSRKPQRAWVVLWVMLAIMLTPVGAVIVYLISQGLSRPSRALHQQQVIEK